VSCGEVHWNLRLTSRADTKQQCRICGSELSTERGRRFGPVALERRDTTAPANAARLGPTVAS
jgi:hypothetical protein